MNQSLEIPRLGFETKQLPALCNRLAPDDSEIRLLPVMNEGGLCHGTLPPGGISAAVKHKTVEEIWCFIQGLGQVWRKQDSQEEVVDVSPGTCLTIPTGTHFQFRNTGWEPLCLVIVTMPPWPEDKNVVEAIPVENHWSVKKSEIDRTQPANCGIAIIPMCKYWILPADEHL